MYGFLQITLNQTVPTPKSTTESSPDTEELFEFTEKGIERAIKKIQKRHKAHEMDGIMIGI